MQSLAAEMNYSETTFVLPPGDQANTVSIVRATTAYAIEYDQHREFLLARILQGIHFRRAHEEGRRQGIRIAVHAFNTFLRPVAPLRHPGPGAWAS